MSRILVNLSDEAGELGPADLPAEAPARLVVKEIVELLGLSAEATDDPPAAYHLLLGESRHRIHPEESLVAAGVMPGDTLILSSVHAEKWLEGAADFGPARKSGLVLRTCVLDYARRDIDGDAIQADAIALTRRAPTDQSRSKGRQLPANRKTVPVEIPNSRAQPAGSSTA
ncbi:MAG: hypothetical protein DCC49_11175 [Acidobacteria bacterium]|nr:MAG: hypothetical protein DCC49_11175 [Acidobacteriota bacterium]